MIYPNLGGQLLMLLNLMVHKEVNCINAYDSFIKYIKYMAYKVMVLSITNPGPGLNSQDCMALA